MNQSILMTVLKKFGFSSIFLEWIEDVLKNQESCVINARTARAYFKLQKGVRQGDPFLFKADIFILASEVFFNLIKTNNKIESSNIFVIFLSIFSLRRYYFYFNLFHFNILTYYFNLIHSGLFWLVQPWYIANLQN